MSIEAVQARIASIESRFGTRTAPPSVIGTVDTSGSTGAKTTFAAALAEQQALDGAFQGFDGAIGSASELGTRGLGTGGPGTSGVGSGSSLADALGINAPRSGPAVSGISGTGTTGWPSTATTGMVTGDKAVALAKQYLGVPYVFGGTDPQTGLDCSALVQLVYKRMGVNLPRLAQDQARVGTEVASLADAKPGDLLAFKQPVGHIAIYMGGGLMIEAPRSGDVVKVSPVRSNLTTIRRIIPEGGVATATSTLVAPTATTASSSSGSYTALFDAAAAKYGLPSGLLDAVAWVESANTPTAVSSAGAQGLMQLLPDVAASLGVNPFDPAQAIDGAARLLSQSLQRFGSLPMALAAYNAGPGAVAQAGGVPAPTQKYVDAVLSAMGERR